MDYAGQELESFALAINWKSYVLKALAPHVSGEVLEVGAGLGETTRALRPRLPAKGWTCLEPDPAMAARVAAVAGNGDLGENVSALCGTLATAPAGRSFDTIVYVDVLEHIEDDRGELTRAAALLRPGGRIVVLSPAFPFLYSEFDKAIGHFRRYTRPMLRAVAPAGLEERVCHYLDGVGLLASAANRFFLRQSLPTQGQVVTWDRLMVPLSRLFDPLVGRSFGRSVVIVWERAPA